MSCKVKESVCSIFDADAEGKFRCQSIFDGDEYGIDIFQYCRRPSCIVGTRSESKPSSMEIYHNRISIFFVCVCIIRLRDVKDKLELSSSCGKSGRNEDLEIGGGRFRIGEMVEFHPNGHKATPNCSLHPEKPAS